jgi:hypothetical protein
MNRCPGRMVRRRQPYSSALFAMQAGGQDSGGLRCLVHLDLLARALICSLVT